MQRFEITDLHALPGNVVDGPGRLVDEVMVRLGDGVEDDAVFAEGETLQKPFFDEKIEGVVNGGTGDPGEVLPNPLPDDIGRRVFHRAQDVVRDGNTLRRWLDPAVAEGVFDLHES